MNVDFLFQLIAQQQAGGGAPQFVGAAPATQIAQGTTEVINVGTAITGIQNGDYVVAVWASDDTTGSDVVFNTGAGLIGEPASLPLSSENSVAPGHFVKGWSYSAASPSLSVSNPSGNEGRDGVLLLAAFRSVQIPVSGNVARAANGVSGNPNAPSLSVSAGSIVLAVGMLDDDGVVMTAPTGFTMATQGRVRDIGRSNATAAIAYQTAASTGTAAPSAFSSPGSDAWYAYTIELRAAT